MIFDEKVPKELSELQKWFAGIITQKMLPDHSICPTTPKNGCIEEESSRYIVQTDTLSRKKRLQIYNQSYWIRLLNILHEEYPFLTRLFGIDPFNDTIGIPYLSSHPPDHWSLNFLGSKMHPFLEHSYHEDDRELVLAASLLDTLYQESFFAKSLIPVDLDAYTGRNAEKLLTVPLKLQPHLHLFKSFGHLLNNRTAFLDEEPEYWETHDFPPLEKGNFYFAIFRNAKYHVVWDELTFEEYTLLSLLQQGCTLEQAQDQVQDLEGVNLDLLEEKIAFWVQSWLLNRWLVPISSHREYRPVQ